MKDFKVSVRKETDITLLREACEATILGSSHVSLQSIYKSEHSPARTQLFWVRLEGIPLYISTHLIRHHVGSVPFQLTCREDRKGGNPHLPAKMDEIVEKLEILSSEISVGGSYSKAQDIIKHIEKEAEFLKENADRYTPVNLCLLVNAQSLIDMSKLRLCTGTAAKETVIVVKAIRNEIAKIDPALASMMVRKCVYRNGLCGEMACCGYNSTKAFEDELRDYVSLFSEKQRGLFHSPKNN